MAVAVWFCPRRVRRNLLLDSTESQHGAIGRGFSRFGTLNLTSIKISGYCWSKTKLDGILVTSWCVAVGIDLFFLSSHSPELQPAERLWFLTNEAIANPSLLNLDELENMLIRCHKIRQQHRLVQELTCFHWWDKSTGTQSLLINRT
jgi:hypothetical protein